MTVIKSPKTKYKVFGENSSSAEYLPVEFATDKLIPKSDWDDIANKNFSFGLESLEGDLQLRDLNSVFYYLGKAVGYLYQRGVPEWNKYEDYPAGALVSYEGTLYVSIAATFGKKEPKEPEYDACGRVCPTEPDCSVPDADPCATESNPRASNNWCAIVTKCEYDAKIQELEAVDKAIKESVDSLKGVEAFKFNETTGNYELQLSDGSTVVAKHEATVELRNFDGSYTAGYLHKASVGG